MASRRPRRPHQDTCNTLATCAPSQSGGSEPYAPNSPSYQDTHKKVATCTAAVTYEDGYRPTFEASGAVHVCIVHMTYTRSTNAGHPPPSLCMAYAHHSSLIPMTLPLHWLALNPAL